MPLGSSARTQRALKQNKPFRGLSVFSVKFFDLLNEIGRLCYRFAQIEEHLMTRLMMVDREDAAGGRVGSTAFAAIINGFQLHPEAFGPVKWRYSWVRALWRRDSNRYVVAYDEQGNLIQYGGRHPLFPLQDPDDPLSFGNDDWAYNRLENDNENNDICSGGVLHLGPSWPDQWCLIPIIGNWTETIANPLCPVPDELFTESIERGPGVEMRSEESFDPETGLGFSKLFSATNHTDGVCDEPPP